MSMLKIITEYVHPPIPIRHYDWSAVYEGYEPGDPIGWGPDEASAMADLILSATEEIQS